MREKDLPFSLPETIIEHRPKEGPEQIICTP
jgi:hypothetical protein